MTSSVSQVEDAGVAQLVEHFLAKEDVARSSRVTRSSLAIGQSRLVPVLLLGSMPEFGEGLGLGCRSGQVVD